MNVVSLAELCGGKIYAALDRQHPSELRDVLNDKNPARYAVAASKLDEVLEQYF